MTLRTVVLEASHEAILTLNLNRLEGEDFDVIRHVVSYEDDGEVITIETCRTMEAFLAGEPNGGRRTYEIPKSMIESVRFVEEEA